MEARTGDGSSPEALRVVIVGGPRCGKTTFSSHFSNVRHTDDVPGWSEASDEVAYWFDAPGPWTVEGVAAVRALRKWLMTRSGKPCDVVHCLTKPRTKLTRGQQSMLTGCRKIWNEVEPELRRRGVKIIVS